MPPLPDRVTPTLAAIHANRVRSRWTGRGSTFIAASEAAQECARSIWLTFRWASPPETAGARMLRLFETGNVEEKRILDDLRAIPGVELHTHGEDGKQFRAELHGYIACKTDGVVLGLPEARKSRHVISCKSANDKNFKAIRSKRVTKSKPEHWLQMQIEMAAFGIKRALYFVVNKNDDDEHVERIKPDIEATQHAIARLIDIAEASRPPAKFRDDAAKPPCMFCRHRGLCHEGGQARMTCRSCLSSSPRPGGNWWCEFWGKELTPEAQGVGCPAHLYIPDLINGDQIDASEAERTVTYKMQDGSIWVDGLEAKNA